MTLPIVAPKSALLPRSLRQILTDGALIAFVLLSAVKLMAGIEQLMDVLLADEEYYLYNGIHVLELGFPAAEWGPFYSVWYWVLSQFEFSHDNLILHDLNQKLLFSLTATLLFVALRSLGCNRVVGMIFTGIYLISGVSVIWPRPAHFALILLLLLIAALRFFKTNLDFYLALGLTLLVMSFVRPEYFLAFMIASAFIVLVFLRAIRFSSDPIRTTLYVKLCAYITVCSLTIGFLGIPTASGNRGWWAFASHYALRWSWANPGKLDPWADYPQIMKLVFGDADTVLEALRANPSAFLQHLGANAIGVVENTIAILSGTLADNSPSIKDINPLLNDGIRKAELGVFLLAIVQILRKLPHLLKQINSTILTRLLVTALFVELAVLPSTVIIFPRYHYLITHVAILSILLAYLLSNALRSSRWNVNLRQACLIGCLLFLLTPTLSSGWCLVGNRCLISREQVPNLPNRETIQAIRSLDINKSSVNMLASGIEYRTYLGDSFHRVDPASKSTGFLQFLRQNQINLIVLSSDLSQDVRFRSDGEWRSFLQNSRSSGYQKWAVPNTDRSLLIHDSLFPAQSSGVS